MVMTQLQSSVQYIAWTMQHSDDEKPERTGRTLAGWQTAFTSPALVVIVCSTSAASSTLLRDAGNSNRMLTIAVGDIETATGM